jgi:hypothetical protein
MSQIIKLPPAPLPPEWNPGVVRGRMLVEMLGEVENCY